LLLNQTARKELEVSYDHMDEAEYESSGEALKDLREAYEYLKSELKKHQDDENYLNKFAIDTADSIIAGS